MAKTRLTGFARLFLFLLVFLPVAFFGISYYKGEDGLANLKNAIGLETNGNGNGAGTQVQTDFNDASVQQLRDQVTELKRRLAISEEQLARCQTGGVD